MKRKHAKNRGMRGKNKNEKKFINLPKLDGDWANIDGLLELPGPKIIDGWPINDGWPIIEAAGGGGLIIIADVGCEILVGTILT